MARVPALSQKDVVLEMAKILSVSYDKLLLSTRQQILELYRHSVKSAFSIKEALQACDSNDAFDLLIVGHTIPDHQKKVLIERFRAKRRTAPVIVLKTFGEGEVRGASLVVELTAEDLVAAVAKLGYAEAVAA